MGNVSNLKLVYCTLRFQKPACNWTLDIIRTIYEQILSNYQQISTLISNIFEAKIVLTPIIFWPQKFVLPRNLFWQQNFFWPQKYFDLINRRAIARCRLDFPYQHNKISRAGMKFHRCSCTLRFQKLPWNCTLTFRTVSVHLIQDIRARHLSKFIQRRVNDFWSVKSYELYWEDLLGLCVRVRWWKIAFASAHF